MKPPLIERVVELYKKGPRIAILMSGKGSNAEKILSEMHRYPNLNFITICTDRANSRACEISQKYNLSYFCHEGKVQTIEERAQYFKKLADYLDAMKIDTVIYAGFMKITTEYFLEKFPGINLHPADLTICDEAGKPKYIGMHAIKDAVLSGESYVASTAHVVDCNVDCGQPIMVSTKLILNNENRTSLTMLHEQLKLQCEHQLYPCVLELLSQGRMDVKQMPFKLSSVVF